VKTLVLIDNLNLMTAGGHFQRLKRIIGAPQPCRLPIHVGVPRRIPGLRHHHHPGPCGLHLRVDALRREVCGQNLDRAMIGGIDDGNGVQRQANHFVAVKRRVEQLPEYAVISAKINILSGGDKRRIGVAGDPFERVGWGIDAGDAKEVLQAGHVV
jgi:hypothetical protein